MSATFLAVGSGSFIARHWLASAGRTVDTVPHDGLDVGTARKYSAIVNFAMAPECRCGPYREAADADLAAARIAASAGTHLVMLSTRKVYQPRAQTVTLDEHSTLGPVDHYGANKLESEQRVSDLLGEKCTILRIANVYGYELQRRSFFGMALTRLRDEQRIVLDVSPFVRRDFIPVERLAGILSRVCELTPSGRFNVGSGIGLALGRIAEWLIQGYGRGRLEISAVEEQDSFIMNIDKLQKALALTSPDPDFETDIKRLGRQLNHE